MGFKLEDGKGTGTLAGVSSDNRIFTSSRTISLLDQGAITGDSYIFDSGVITLTSASESAIITLKNTNSDKLLQIVSINYSIGKSNAPGNVQVKAIANITGGTLLSATVVTGVNRNFGINTPAVATAFAGSEGKTATGGTLYNTKIFQDQTDTSINTGTILSNGSSYTTSIIPPVGNTSMLVDVFFRVVYIDFDQI